MTNPRTTCGYCEYFDGGGLRLVELARRDGRALPGDCLNRKAPRFETTSADSCDHFAPDSGIAAQASENPLDFRF